MTDWTPSAVLIMRASGVSEPIDAAVSWPLAVHPAAGGSGWAVTHIPTGCRVKTPWPTRAAAVQAADRILAAVPTEALARRDAYRDDRFQAAVRELEVERVH
jgi:hypothetical protein